MTGYYTTISFSFFLLIPDFLSNVVFPTCSSTPKTHTIPLSYIGLRFAHTDVLLTFMPAFSRMLGEENNDKDKENLSHIFVDYHFSSV